MAHNITMFDVTDITLSKPKTIKRKDNTAFKTQTITIKSDRGNITLTLFLK